MKTLLFIAATVAACGSFAQNSKLQPYQATLKQVMSLEANGEIKKAVYVSAQASNQIAASIGMDQVVSTVTSKLNKMQQEVVTNRSSVGGGFSLLFFISGSAKASWDTTKIITTNPEQVAGFDAKVASDFSTLQKNVSAYVRTNELAIVYSKAFAAKALQLATTLSSEDRADVSRLILQTYNNTQAMSFIGAQQIMNCTTTNYADRSSSAKASVSGILFSFGLSAHTEQLAHTEKRCDNSVKQTSVSEAGLISAKLAEVDDVAAAYSQHLGLIELTDAKAQAYPTWGGPYYK